MHEDLATWIPFPELSQVEPRWSPSALKEAQQPKWADPINQVHPPLAGLLAVSHPKWGANPAPATVGVLFGNLTCTQFV